MALFVAAACVVGATVCMVLAMYWGGCALLDRADREAAQTRREIIARVDYLMARHKVALDI